MGGVSATMRRAAGRMPPARKTPAPAAPAPRGPSATTTPAPAAPRPCRRRPPSAARWASQRIWQVDMTDHPSGKAFWLDMTDEHCRELDLGVAGGQGDRRAHPPAGATPRAPTRPRRSTRSTPTGTCAAELRQLEGAGGPQASRSSWREGRPGPRRAHGLGPRGGQPRGMGFLGPCLRGNRPARGFEPRGPRARQLAGAARGGGGGGGLAGTGRQTAPTGAPLPAAPGAEQALESQLARKRPLRQNINCKAPQNIRCFAPFWGAA